MNTTKSHQALPAATLDGLACGLTPIDERPSGDDPTELREARRRRLDEYRKFALKEKNLLCANLAMANADLMETCLHLGEAINGRLSRNPGSLEQIQKVAPTIEMYLRVARQVDRLAQLDVQAPQTRKKAAARSKPKPR